MNRISNIIISTLIFGCGTESPPKIDISIPKVEAINEAIEEAIDEVIEEKKEERIVKRKNDWDWSYEVDSNPMDGDNIYAHAKSKNTISLDFPYQGEQAAILVLTNQEHKGKVGVKFGVPRGQIMCMVGVGCDVRIKLDGQPAFSWRAHPAASGESNIILFANASRLINKLKGSKKIYIEVLFFQNGSKIMEFDLSTLSWEKIKL